MAASDCYMDIISLDNLLKSLKFEFLHVFCFFLYFEKEVKFLFFLRKKKEKLMASLAKWLSVRLRTKWLRIRVQLQGEVLS